MLNSIGLTISEPVDTMVASLKICKIHSGKESAMWASKVETETPFTPSSFNEVKANKLNLDIRCTDEYSDFFSQLDCWAVDYIADNYLRLCGRYLSLNTVKQMYRPCIKKKGNFDPLLRAKITLEGMQRTKYWTLDKSPRLKPDCWQATTFKIKVRISYLYVTNDALGLALDCTDVQVCKEFTPVPDVCPL
jgi:hypothetical protein